MKYDLGFGNAVCVRDAFLKTYHGNMVVFTAEGLNKFEYPPYTGDPELIEMTHQVIKRQINREYKHVFLTNGATGAVVIALRAFQKRGYRYCHTRNAPWYLRYPSMIKAAGLNHVDEKAFYSNNESLILLDIPSNPVAAVHAFKSPIATPTIFDGVYFNNVYRSGYHIEVPAHDVYVGSYSKLLGLTGIRVGWLATDDGLLAERLKELIMAEYCGLSVASTEILKNVLFDFDWTAFELIAKMHLNYNREEFQKLERFFDRQVRYDGMFYYGRTDTKVRGLLEKVGIKYVKGSEMGTDDNWGRFNLGQDIDLIRKAANAMVREDLRPKKK